MTTGMDELKRRLEILLGAKPEAAEDQSMKAQVEKQAEVLARKEKVATAGGQLVGAAFAFIGEMFSISDENGKGGFPDRNLQVQAERMPGEK